MADKKSETENQKKSKPTPDWVEDKALYERMDALRDSKQLSKKQYRAYQEVDERVGPEQGGLTMADKNNLDSEKITKALEDWSKVADVYEGARDVGIPAAVVGGVAGAAYGATMGAVEGAAGGAMHIASAATSVAITGAGAAAIEGAASGREGERIAQQTAVAGAAGAAIGAVVPVAFGAAAIGAICGAVGAAAGGAVGGAVGAAGGAAKEYVIDRAFGGNEGQVKQMRKELSEAFEIAASNTPVVPKDAGKKERS